MANNRSANTWYVDSAAAYGDLAFKGITVTGVLVTATGAYGQIVLADIPQGAGSNLPKLDLRVASTAGNTSGDSRYYDFSSNPVLFPNGIRVMTLNACVATLMGDASGG